MSLFLSLFKRSLLRYFFATWSFFLQITGQTFSHFNTSEDRSTVLYHTYLMAHYYHRTGMLQRAGSYYRRLVAKGASAYIYDGYIPLLFDSGDFKTITQIAEEKKSELAPLLENNVQLTLIIAQAYLNTDQTDKADQHFLSLSKAFPHNEQVAYHAVIALLKKGALDQALVETKKHLENVQLRSKHFLFHFLQAQIFLQKNNKSEALLAVNKSLELFPKFDRGWLFKGMLLEQKRENKEAITCYQKVLALVGREELVEKQLVHLLFSEQRYAEAAHYLERINGTCAEYFFDLALIYARAGKSTKAVATIDKALERDPHLHRARLLKIDLLAQKKMPKELTKELALWLQLYPQESKEGLQVLMLLRQQLVKTEPLIHALEEVVKAKSSFHQTLVLAELYAEKKSLDRALELYKKAVALTENKEIKTSLLLQVATLHTHLAQPEGAEKILEEALAQSESNPLIHNALAYHYAQHKKKLPYAHQLIDKALALNPDSVHFLDTKGYILLQEGDKQQARYFFEKALLKAPDNETLKLHLKQTE